MYVCQARNICMLAKYGNKGTITKQATAQSAGITNYKVSGQVCVCVCVCVCV